jgi:hypothetical protein
MANCSSWASTPIKRRQVHDQAASARRSGLTFVRNHTPEIAAMDLFVVPTIGFELLYAFIIVRLDRRHLVWINATTNPTAEWVVRQITEAFPWNEAPRHLISRSRWYLRRNRNSAAAGDGYPGQADCTSVALAEWICRATDRIDPARMPRPCDRPGRGASAQNPESLCRLLQLDNGTPIGPVLSVSFFILGIPGPGGRSTSMK